MRMLKRDMIDRVMLLIFILLLLISIAVAAPQGPGTLTQDSTSRRTAGLDTQSGVQVQAEAGNVTQLTITSIRLTDYWQGYYGNVTGAITLDNADNFTMYDWSLASPTGEIYAANSSISSWSNVICMNVSYDKPGYNCSLTETDANPECLNVTEIETYYGMSSTDKDGVNETFTTTASLNVGLVSLTDCPAVNLYQNDSSQSTYWDEALLSINNTETIIFASILEDDVYGFNNQTWDFQMIVGENSAAGTSTYWFYVELA